MQNPTEEPTECPLCRLDPVSALAAGMPPAVITHPGWVRCDCSGPKPFHVGEALGIADEKSEDQKLRSEILRCWFEEVNRPHEPGGSSNGSSRKKDVPRSDIRAEQEVRGFVEQDHSQTERLEDLVVPCKVTIPAYLRSRWKSESATTESRYVRWLITKHLIDVATPTKIPRGAANIKFKFLMTPSHAVLWRAKKHALGCSNSELLAAILLKEWT